MLTLILGVGVPDLQDPVLTARLVEGGEPDVRGVAVHARGQEVGVRVSDPGHRQVPQILDGARDVGGLPLDADDGFARTLHEVRSGEGASGVGRHVVVELSQVVAGPPGGVAWAGQENIER